MTYVAIFDGTLDDPEFRAVSGSPRIVSQVADLFLESSRDQRSHDRIIERELKRLGTKKPKAGVPA